MIGEHSENPYLNYVQESKFSKAKIILHQEFKNYVQTGIKINTVYPSV